MAVISPAPDSPRRVSFVWILPALFLCCAYSLLALTGVTHVGDVMDRCVLMDPKLSRIWSVAHIEIGLSYMGVFCGMAYFLLRASKVDPTHLTDLAVAFAYLLGSFLLDFCCVRYFNPFVALLIGDAIVMTFTLIVSRQLWFQRLLGIFVPLVFFTCSLGHFMEGMSYWKLTYPVNVPWTMVTADIGFAILVNAGRFPAFIRGQDIVTEMEEAKFEARQRHLFLRDVLLSVTEGRLHYCETDSDLPLPLPVAASTIHLSRETLHNVRAAATEVARARGFSSDEINDVQTAVGEAAMNAIVHGGGGEAIVRAEGGHVQVWIIDRGGGIHLTQLPRATLERGFSTKDTLGQGFWLMLQTMDRVDLLTDSHGTTLVLTRSHDLGKD
jgi:anti-sigma regulatory factor (Ser/Thr protein kinase)/Na+-translocating ferredoxin:NAD+ oxidoreductase RnfA subunit